MDAVLLAFQMVFSVKTLVPVFFAALFGLFVGAVPGLTATMATALLVPVTFFMEPIPAIATIVTATAMAIFSGDIPGCLLRMPGTPASAAYADEAYAMTRKGQAETALGAGLVFSVIGGLFGTIVLIVSAPALAEVALKFSSFEYFWLVLLGLTCAIVITAQSPLKGIVSLLIGLLIACVGLGNPAGFPRFTFGNTELMGGIGLIPLMIGMFAISEIIRFVVDTSPPLKIVDQPIHNVFKGMWALAVKYPMQVLRGSVLGTLVGRAARRRCRHRRVDVLRDQQEDVEGAGEVRHRARRRHRRVGRRQQQRHRRRVDPGAGVRHSRRLDHGHRDRRAVHEEHESRARRCSRRIRRTSTRSTCSSSWPT